jgi:hypothetical protein
MGHADGVRIYWKYSSGVDAPPPENEKDWVDVIEPIIRPAGKVMLLWRQGGRWHVPKENAYQTPPAQPVGSGKVEDKHINKRAEVVAALKAKGLPVEDN